MGFVAKVKQLIFGPEYIEEEIESTENNEGISITIQGVRQLSNDDF